MRKPVFLDKIKDKIATVMLGKQSPEAVDNLLKKGAFLVDVRTPEETEKGMIQKLRLMEVSGK